MELTWLAREALIDAARCCEACFDEMWAVIVADQPTSPERE